ncbi:rod shape-determining protein MreC [Spongiivirga citrea]|uniref:Cell shape-determining protein MreC n=1 Tax=Spongiivirga citrea TaxID=1481457 RepID=A0A6M0CKA5_9FLAO|nr:rod shape-determining protein MreC [Spongiivirga citrea]NER18271.1 rod shape-determining protein MreC [Spongiivirga citrea]
MQQIFNFIFRNKNFLLFLLLFVLSMIFTVQSHSYHRSKFVNSANFLSGGIYSAFSNIDEYFALKSTNEELVEENLRLRKMLFNPSDSLANQITIDSTSFDKNYILVSTKVIQNDFTRRDNFLTIKKGSSQGIEPDMGVFNSKGIVGIIDKTSSGYSTVISILNSTSQINAEIKKTQNFGTLKWDGKSPYTVQLADVPKRARIAIGDSIITGGRSTIFPKGIHIGAIKDFKLDGSENYYEIEVELFNDMTKLNNVYVIKNKDAEEIKALQNSTNE